MASFPWDARSDELLLSLHAGEYNWDQITETMNTEFGVLRTKEAYQKKFKVLKSKVRPEDCTRPDEDTIEDTIEEIEELFRDSPPLGQQSQSKEVLSQSKPLRQRVASHLETLMGSEMRDLKTLKAMQFEGQPLSHVYLHNVITMKRADGTPRFIRVRRGCYRVNTTPIIWAKTNHKHNHNNHTIRIDQLVAIVRQHGGITKTLTVLSQAKQISTQVGGLEKAIATITTLKELF